MTLVHLSDLHFGTENLACLEAIQHFCQIQRPEVIVVSGDLTQRARSKQFISCKAFLDSLSCPYFVVAGNHDIPLFHLWRRLFRPFAGYQKYFAALEPVLETEHFYLIGLNSIRPYYHSKGAISQSQIARVKQCLQYAPQNKLKLVVSHQPFITQYSKHHRHDAPRLARAAIAQWQDYDLFAVLHGHLHQIACYDLKQEYNLDCAQPIFSLLAGTATSTRHYQQQANSFNVVLKNGCIQHYVFDPLRAEFLLHVPPLLSSVL
ncbi:metallophosphoesterase family protein [Acinetobacter larvae]|uniref:3',5'-cyclic-nucleotide phosphodiesterase n=1 Tax=Acinetobacter larvae TaxID=1789224 RepID=A0A1B2LXS7_9GAMM|nr:metallophosphoesterase [Acinetobacter larvae]AOA57741.1 3',5'-cyclic-nucleotide phosphodiesterase [Acinetobacter larvae]